VTTLLGVAIGMTAMGCGSPSVAPTPSAAPSGAMTTDVCRPIDLRTPSGERVDLTGSWSASVNSPIFYVFQDADCVWIIGPVGPAYDSRGPGTLWDFTFVFDGHLRSDFTVLGRWATLNYVTGPGVSGPFSGTGEWTLDVTDPMTLRSAEFPPILVKISQQWVEPPELESP